MAAYLILNYDVLDAELLAAYRQAAAPMLVGPRAGALLVSTPNTLDLGEASDAGTDTVIIRFEDRAHALRAYHSGAYQAILRDRLSATIPRLAMVVDGPGNGVADRASPAKD